MGNENGRRIGIGSAVELLKKKLGRVNPVGANIEGPDLTPEEREEQRLANLLGTKKHADAAEGKIPFDDVEGHRKMRGLK